MDKSQSKLRVLTSLILLLAFFVAACSGGGGQQPATKEPTQEPTQEPVGLCSNIYYPVVAGASWTYSVSGAPTGDFSFTDTITDVRPDGFTLTSSFPDGLTRTQEWSCTQAGLVSLQFGGGAAAALSGSGLDATFTTTSVTGLTLPSNLAVGSTWTQSLEIQGEITLPGDLSGSAEGSVDYAANAIAMESVTTPAGKFQALKIEFATTFDLTATVEIVTLPVTITGVTTSWYAPGVGWIRSVESSSFMEESVSTTIELQSYTIP